MSKIDKGILGGVRGKIGNVVGYNKYGKAIIATNPGKIGAAQPGQLTGYREMFYVFNKFFAQRSSIMNEYLFPNGYRKNDISSFLMKKNGLKDFPNSSSVQYIYAFDNIRWGGGTYFVRQSLAEGVYVQFRYGNQSNNPYGDTEKQVFNRGWDMKNRWVNSNQSVRPVEQDTGNGRQYSLDPPGFHIWANFVFGVQSGICYNAAMVKVFNPG